MHQTEQLPSRAPSVSRVIQKHTKHSKTPSKSLSLELLASLASHIGTDSTAARYQQLPYSSTHPAFSPQPSSHFHSLGVHTQGEEHFIQAAPIPIRPIAVPAPITTTLNKAPSLPVIPEATPCLSGFSSDSQRSPRSAFYPICASPPMAESPTGASTTASPTTEQLMAVNRQLNAVFESMGPSLLKAGAGIEECARRNEIATIQWVTQTSTLLLVCKLIAKVLGDHVARDLLGSARIQNPNLPPLPGRSPREVLARLGSAIAQAGASIAVESDKVGKLGWMFEPHMLALYYALKNNGPNAEAFLPFCIKFQPFVQKAKAYGLLPMTPF